MLTLADCSRRALRVMPERRASRAPSPGTEPTPEPAANEAHPAADSPSPDSPAPTPATPQPDRTGVDTRQRGWYWHWNGIVTQYAPLIGLKGIGLLNSYTVWTDRRDQSPTRGYAFPSQQAEAAFYGEDRAELITINKILVALDLIEIRKEMVQRTDAKGRRWRVPHNLYRVKDRPEGIELRTEDVLRVAELASRDAAVYRYVRRMFSGRFAPIDRDNAWHRILEEVADDPLWKQLAEKTAKAEARASARSRAGHKARTRNTSSKDSDTSTPEMTTGHSERKAFAQGEHQAYGDNERRTSVEPGNNGSTTKTSDVADGNNGSEPDVGAANRGSEGGDESSVEATNNGPASVVAPGNATYYQETSTTTTTTTGGRRRSDNATRDGSVADQPTTSIHPPEVGQQADVSGAKDPRPARLDHDATALPAGNQPETDRAGQPADERRPVDPASGGPLVDPGPLVVSLFEAANDRSATPLERILLGELERDAAVPAGRCGESGADWVAAALREAVASGSAFVAPKRIGEIINRWASVGSRPGGPAPQAAGVAGAGEGEQDPPREVRLPRGRRAAKIWQAVLDDFSRVLQPDIHQRLFQGSRIVGYSAGVVVIEVAPEGESKLSGEYRPMLLRYLRQHLGMDVDVRLEVVDIETAAPDEPAADTGDAPLVVSRSDAEQARQLWRAVLNEVRPLVGADDLVRLGGSLPLGQDPDGSIVVGASTSLAGRLIEGRCRTAVEAALEAVLGVRASVRVAASGSWLVDEDEVE